MRSPPGASYRELSAKSHGERMVLVRCVRSIVTWARSFPGRAVACMAATAFVLGAAYSVHLGGDFRYLDERDYFNIAHNLATRHTYSLDGATATAFRAPGWPFLLSIFSWLGAGATTLRLVSVTLFAATIVVVYLLARRIAGRDVGLLAALLVAFNPLMLYTATTLYPETLALFLVTFSVWMIVEAAAAMPTNRVILCSALAGVGFSVLVLTSPAHAVVAVPATAWLIWRRGWPLGAAAATLIALLCIVGPVAWGVRNQERLGSFVPLATNGGQNLLLGNSPNTTATSGSDVDLSRYDRVIADRHLDEVQADKYMREQAIDWIHAHPARAGTLYLEKLAKFFNFRNDLTTSGQRSTAVDLVSALSYYPLLLIFGIRLLRWRRYPFHPGELMLAVAYLMYALVCARVLHPAPLPGTGRSVHDRRGFLRNRCVVYQAARPPRREQRANGARRYASRTSTREDAT